MCKTVCCAVTIYNNSFCWSCTDVAASGGMDNQCTVHDLNNRDNTGVAKVARELKGYEGFLCCSRFLDDQNLLTGSGDMKV